eukprot:GABV01007091.1.p1 GENE.GABV01007091.1~~GABV01007091.1.p1  ORF type:complete len:118 (-),score=31.82 GABV01007091.1:3-356(-)
MLGSKRCFTRRPHAMRFLRCLRGCECRPKRPSCNCKNYFINLNKTFLAISAEILASMMASAADAGKPKMKAWLKSLGAFLARDCSAQEIQKFESLFTLSSNSKTFVTVESTIQTLDA